MHYPCRRRSSKASRTTWISSLDGLATPRVLQDPESHTLIVELTTSSAVEGRIRVALGPSAAHHCEAGECLVARTTGPSHLLAAPHMGYRRPLAACREFTQALLTWVHRPALVTSTRAAPISLPLCALSPRKHIPRTCA